MKTVEFAHGETIPALGQGSWHFGQGRRPAVQEEAALNEGFALGLRVVDTAEMYGDGRSESLIGRVLGDPRPFVISKVYPHHATRSGLPKACAASLSRLGIDCLDLYLLHWRGGVPLAETVAGLEALKAEGKIRAWGVSNFDVSDMEDLYRVPGGRHCATNQVLYNPASRGIEHALLPWCARQRMPVIAYSPLGSRHATGSDLLSHPTLAAVAERHRCSPAAVALAWTIRSGNVVAIPEAGDVAHVRDNAKALELVLDQEDLASIDAAFPAPTGKVPLEML